MNKDFINANGEIVIIGEGGSRTVLDKEYQEYIHELVDADMAMNMLLEHPLTSEIVKNDSNAMEKLTDCFLSAKDEAIEMLSEMFIKQALLTYNYLDTVKPDAADEDLGYEEDAE